MFRLRKENESSFQAFWRQACLLQGLLSKAQTAKTLLIGSIKGFWFFVEIWLVLKLSGKGKLSGFSD